MIPSVLCAHLAILSFNICGVLDILDAMVFDALVLKMVEYCETSNLENHLVMWSTRCNLHSKPYLTFLQLSMQAAQHWMFDRFQ